MARILVIDDEELVRQVVRQSLKEEGHSVGEAVDGDEGLKKFRENDPDVVITDILMPKKEGIETIQEMRRIRPDVAIIAMSGGGRMRDTSFLFAAKILGADSALEKPFSLDALKRTVDKTLADKLLGQRA